jgi:hypothetical protein
MQQNNVPYLGLVTVARQGDPIKRNKRKKEREELSFLPGRLNAV